MTYQELIHVALNIASLVVGFIALIAILALIINKTNAKTPEILAIAGSIIGAKVWRAQGIKWLMPVVVIAIVILVGWFCKDATAQVIDLILLAIMVGVVLKSMAGQMLLSDNVAVSERKAVLTATVTESGATSTEQEVGRSIIEEAKKYEGYPYVYGGNSLSGRGGIDCSHFTWRVYKNTGLISQEAGYYCTPDMWEHMEDFMEEWNLRKLPSTNLEDAIDGDILLYSTAKDGSEVHHVGMFIKDGGYLAEAKGSAYGITMTYAAFKEPNDYIVAIFRSKKGLEGNNESEAEKVSAESESSATSSADLFSRLSEATGASQKVVCLDAGHGGDGISSLEDNDPDGTSQKTAQSTGTESKNGLLEKDVNLAVTLATGKLLEEAGVKVVYTRTTDEAVSNIERARIANNASADIFVRIHCEGDDNSSRRGCYCYCITAKNQWQATNYAQSRKLCETILSAFSAKAGMPVDKSFKDGILEDDGLTSNNWAEMPTALIEMGNMRNSADEEIQRNSVDLMAQGIAEGILQYLK